MLSLKALHAVLWAYRRHVAIVRQRKETHKERKIETDRHRRKETFAV